MKIISAVPLSSSQRSLIERAAGEAEITDRLCRSSAEVTELVSGGCDVLLTFILPEEPTACVPGLKWIQLLSAGADQALGVSLAGGRVIVTTTSGIHATPIAEYVIGSMLAYAHQMHASIRAQVRHEWIRRKFFMAKVDELRGRTLGVIGYGSIGRETARLADALGMTVLALKREPSVRRDTGWCLSGLGDPEGKIPRRFYGPTEREAILGESDYVAVTLPLTPYTRGFIGGRELAAMKPSAYIVNVGRGELVDEPALTEALKEKRIGGAGLDVFWHEPLSAESPLWDMDNVILTPHMAGASRIYMDKACDVFAENLRRFRSDRPLVNQVDFALGY